MKIIDKSTKEWASHWPFVLCVVELNWCSHQDADGQCTLFTKGVQWGWGPRKDDAARKWESRIPYACVIPLFWGILNMHGSSQNGLMCMPSASLSSNQQNLCQFYTPLPRPCATGKCVPHNRILSATNTFVWIPMKTIQPVPLRAKKKSSQKYVCRKDEVCFLLKILTMSICLKRLPMLC